jgi:hypothetical protein
MKSPSLAKNSSVVASATGPFLKKLGKHLAVLSCLMIAGTGTGRASIGSFGILLTVVAASLAHLFGRAVERRTAALVRLSESGL